MNRVKGAFLFFLFISIPFPAWAQGYGTDVPYQQAAPNFWTAATNAVEPYSDKESVAGWGDGVALRIEEFLGDMISASSAMPDKPLGSPDISEIEAFQQKWQAVRETCPECENLAPLVDPIVEELLAGLPTLRKTRPDDTPFQNFFELFQKLEALNPWGTAAFFQLEPVSGRRNLVVSEEAHETKDRGVEKVTVNDRTVRQTENGEVVFEERIKDDKVENVAFTPDSVTMLHETLDGLIRDGGDPQVIAMLQELTGLVDDELTKAWQAGLLDDFTYDYLFHPDRIRNELVHVKHPLLKEPFIQEYKTAEFYPRSSGETTTASAVSTLADRSRRMQAALDEYSQAAHNVSAFWVFGLAPLSFLSLMGLGKPFL